MNKENKIQLLVIGRIDCFRVAALKYIVKDYNKINNNTLHVDFELHFETNFEKFREKLLKDNVDSAVAISPVVYLIEKNKKLIGTYEDLAKWSIMNLSYYFDVDPLSFKNDANSELKRYISASGNKYCYFDINIERRYLKRLIIELFNDCPNTSNNFLSLCKGFKNEKGNIVTYENSFINRIVKNGYIQGGDLNDIVGNKTIFGGEFADENYNHNHNDSGIIGMVKKGGRKHTNETQFYITLNPISAFDKNFVAFGRVIMGFKSLIEIEKEETNLQRPINEIKIVKCGEYSIK